MQPYLERHIGQWEKRRGVLKRTLRCQDLRKISRTASHRSVLSHDDVIGKIVPHADDIIGNTVKEARDGGADLRVGCLGAENKARRTALKNRALAKERRREEEGERVTLVTIDKNRTY